MGLPTYPSKLLISFTPLINTVLLTLINTWKVCKWPTMNSFVKVFTLVKKIYFGVKKCPAKNCWMQLMFWWILWTGMVFVTALNMSEFGVEQKELKNRQRQTRFDLETLTSLLLEASGLEATQPIQKLLRAGANDLLLQSCCSPGWDVGCFQLPWVLWVHQTSLYTRLHAHMDISTTHYPHRAELSSCTRHAMQLSLTMCFRHSLHGRRGCHW